MKSLKDNWKLIGAFLAGILISYYAPDVSNKVGSFFDQGVKRIASSVN